jgi:hypothetical protein
MGEGGRDKGEESDERAVVEGESERRRGREGLNDGRLGEAARLPFPFPFPPPPLSFSPLTKQISPWSHATLERSALHFLKG